MDDPWGSPWAEETQFEKAGNLEEKGKHEDAGPLETPAKAATLNLQATTSSPWDDGEDDEDGFGDWAAEPAKDNGDSGLDATGFKWNTHIGSQAVLSPDPISLQWNLATSSSNIPKLAPGPVTDNLERQHSPDPWKTEFTLDNDTHAPIEQHDSDAETVNEQAKADAVLEIEDPEKEVDEDAKTSQMNEGEETETPTTLQVQSHQQGSSSVTYTDRTAGEDGRVHSRLSSSSSVVSQREGDDGQLETPRTSTDDDHTRPQLSRKVSAKIQPLVQHFDGLSAEPKDPGHGSQRTHNKSTEELSSVAHGLGGLEEIVPEASARTPQTADDLKVEQALNEDRTRSSTHQQLLSSQSDKTAESELPLKTTTDIGDAVDISVDLSLLDLLFPDYRQKEVEDVFIPDVVPYDSFSSSEQRKIWYRISRYGSMRKHDSGDEDNYSRVSWSNSTVRNNTLKIVARWMEEDRLSGQVMLGGSGRTSVLFGWGDTKSPPVSLAAVFATKESKRLSTSSNTVPVQPEKVVNINHRRPSLDFLDKRKEIVPEPAHITTQVAPIAAFGWSSNSNIQNGQHQNKLVSQAEVKEMPQRSNSRPSLEFKPVPMAGPISFDKSFSPVDVLAPTLTQTSHIVEHAVVQSKEIIMEGTASYQDSIDDEEDDWGDMVSSPTIETPSGQNQNTNATQSSLVQNHTADLFDIPAKPEPLEGNKPVNSAGSIETNPAKPSQSSQSLDAWASADFSFFDQAPKPAVKAAPTVESTKTKSLRPSAPKRVTFSDVPTTAQAVHPATQSKAKETFDQDKVVQDIIKNLPDLSYMFKK